jgi:hypothetical protein
LIVFLSDGLVGHEYTNKKKNEKQKRQQSLTKISHFNLYFINMITRNSTGIKFDVEDLKKQIDAHVAYMRDTGKKNYSIEKAMKKC